MDNRARCRIRRKTGSPAGIGPGDRGAARALSTLAKVPAARLLALWSDWLGAGGCPAHEVLRPPEIGTVMVRGRAGAKGAPFNLGEMTVTRATVRLPDGAVGHGHVQGRDKDAALAAALIDALCEAGEDAALEAAILAPLREEAEAQRRSRAAGRRRRRSSFSPWSGERRMSTQYSMAGSRTRPARPPTRFAVRLQALSRPGRIETLAGAAPPAPVRRRRRADPDALRRDDAVHLAPSHDTEALRGWITFHTGAPLVGAEAAAFALGTWEALQPWTDSPSVRRNTRTVGTLIVEMPALSATGARLTGPGIETEARLSLPEIAAFRPTARGSRSASTVSSPAGTGWRACRAPPA
jgi:alpha-D-ribose 1-methylphosphonate 5-triphosphate synthase subunit PhnG